MKKYLLIGAIGFVLIFIVETVFLTTYFGAGVLVFLFFLIIMIITVGKLGRENLNAESSEMGLYLEIKREQIRYFQKGEGKDVLLVHGTPGSLEDWQPLIDSLARTHRVTAFDRPGHGYSSANQIDYSLERNATIIDGLIEKLALGNVVLVGHSYGGIIAVHVAVNQNPKIASVVIVAAPLYHIEVNGMLHILTMPLLGKGFCVFLARTVAPKMMEQVIIDLFNGNRDKVSNDFIDCRKKIWAQPKVIYAMSKEIVNAQRQLNEITAKYPNINVPVTIVVGEEDKKTIIEDSKEAQAVIPNSKLVIFENSAHYVQYEKSEALSELIRGL